MDLPKEMHPLSRKKRITGEVSNENISKELRNMGKVTKMAGV